MTPLTEHIANSILNSELLEIGRACDLTWWIFSKKGTTFALHTQCTWRIFDETGIILRRNDIYFPANGLGDEECFDWDVRGNNLFDECRESLIQRLPAHVEEVTINELNDICICLSNNWTVQIIADTAKKDEQWRFLPPLPEKQHIVCQSDCVAIQ